MPSEPIIDSTNDVIPGPDASHHPPSPPNLPAFRSLSGPKGPVGQGRWALVSDLAGRRGIQQREVRSYTGLQVTTDRESIPSTQKGNSPQAASFFY